MTRFIDDTERRARLARQHLLAGADQAASPADVASALTAIHSTDPASTVLGILARTSGTSIEEVEHALYVERSIVRVLGMRRTVFAVDFRLVPAIWTSFDATVARNQLRLLNRMLEESGISDPTAWIAASERRLLAFLESHPESSSTEIARDDPYLSVRLSLPGSSGPSGTQSVASRMLTYLSAKGDVIRGRPRGGWTSSQFTWDVTRHWRADWPDRPSAENADTQIACSWLAGHGPATIDDLAWWTGWTKGRSRKAIEQVGGIEVRTTEGTAFVLPGDLAPVDPPALWVALLPGLDSSTMGWKRREFYLGPHAPRVFDNVGNAGPTVWVDGRVAGGWAQRESGDVVFELFEDIGREAVFAIESKAEHLATLLKDVRIKPRGRRYTASERSLL